MSISNIYDAACGLSWLPVSQAERGRFYGMEGEETMKWSMRLLTAGAGVLALTLLTSTTLFEPSALATSPARKGGHDSLRTGPVTLETKTSRPLHQPVNVPRPVVFVRGKSTGFVVPARSSGPLQIGLVPCLLPTLDLKVLVIAADGTEADLPAIEQTLNYLGTPYSVYQAARTPGGLTPGMLASGCHGYYQGIVLTDGVLSYFTGSSYVSALLQQK